MSVRQKEKECVSGNLSSTDSCHQCDTGGLLLRFTAPPSALEMSRDSEKRESKIERPGSICYFKGTLTTFGREVLK